MEISLAISNIGYFVGLKWFWKDVLNSPRHYFLSFIVFFSIAGMYGAAFITRASNTGQPTFTTITMASNAVCFVLYHIYVYVVWEKRLRQERASKIVDSDQEPREAIHD